MWFLLGVAGALLGSVLGNGPAQLYCAALGALIGAGFAQLYGARRRIESLEREVAALRRAGVSRAAPSASEGAEGAREANDGLEGRWGSAREYYSRASEAARQTTPGDVEPTGPATSVQGTVAGGRPATTAPPAATRTHPATERPVTGTPSGANADSVHATAGPNAAAAGGPDAAGWQSAGRAPSPPGDPPLLRVIRDYFTGGNTLVRVGVVILFIGVAFLLRYIAEHTHVPIQLRLSGVAAAGVVLLALGWRLRKTRPGYALTLQGGAIGILYLTVFASLRLFHVLSPGPAFAVLVLLAAFSAALAILQSSMAFAVLAAGCGFLAPILASTGQGNHVILFSYYGVLNLGILGIAWFKAWRPLNVVGFLFTFVIGTAWGVLRYRPELFASTEPFLVAFFVLYVAIAILFSLRQKPVLRGYVDGTLVFGVPVVAFGLQSVLVHDRPFWTAFSAVAVSAMYLALAGLLHRAKRDTQRLLVEAFMALGVAFLTLAVPLALDGRWSAATWALEGAALVWVGCRQNRRLPRAFGALLQFAAGVLFLADIEAPYGSVPVLNSACLGGVMIAFASVFAAHSFQKIRGDLQDYELPFTSILFGWGLFWWALSGCAEIVRHVPEAYVRSAILILFALTALLSSELHRRLQIVAARVATSVLPVAMAVAILTMMANPSHPLVGGGWVAWPVAFAALYFLAHRHERTDRLWAPNAIHPGGALLLVGLLTWETSWQIDAAVKGGGSWPAIAWVLVPALALYLLPKLAARVSWPFAAHREAYVAVTGTVLALYVGLWSLGTNLSMPGDPFPLPYVPVLNPLDLAQVFALLVLGRHALHLHARKYPELSDVRAPQLVAILAGLGFVWLNAVLLRTLHHWSGVPYELEPLLSSTLVQTALSIFWTVLALATMLFATRRQSRIVWIAGAVLMGVVILKLFMVDLSRVGTVERIVSFVGVGLLMLVVGYFSPLPPAEEKAA